MTAIVVKQTAREPDNPIGEERAPSSHILLSSSSTSGSGIDGGVLSDIKKAEINNETSQSKEGNKAETDKPGETGDKKQTDNQDKTGGDENKGKEKEGTIPTTSPDGNTNLVYFTTSIKEGSTISQRDYSFTLTHKKKELKVKELKVYVNNIVQTQFKGNVLLSEGKNSIRVSVQYINEKNELIAVYKDYTLYVNTGDIAITTNLHNQTVDSPQLSFRAIAVLNGNEIPLNVRINNKSLSAKHDAFAQEHGQDTDQQLIAYITSCARQLGYAPHQKEIIG